MRTLTCCSEGARLLKDHTKFFAPAETRRGNELVGVEFSFCPFCGAAIPPEKISELEQAEQRPATVVFDFDGVICKAGAADYSKAEPYPHAIDFVNLVYDMGVRVVIQTARYMLRCDGDPQKAAGTGFFEAQFWLQEHGVKYHELHFGKRGADLYVDDRGCRVESAKGAEDWRQQFWPRLQEIINRKEAARAAA